MATENDLRDRFKDDDGRGLPGIDVESVIRRSRSRRTPRLVAVGAAGALAVVALAFPAIGAMGLIDRGVTVSASDTAGGSPEGAAAPDVKSESDGDAPTQFDEPSADDGIRRAPADKLNLCTGALAEVAPAENGLVLTASFPEALAGSSSVAGSVTMTNTGSERVTGTTGPSPAITLSQDGVVLWHSNGPQIMMISEVDLAPGATMTFPAAFSPVSCGVDDDSAESFGDDLPALGAGTYQVSAALDLNVENSGVDAVSSESGLVLVTGPTADVILR